MTIDGTPFDFKIIRNKRIAPNIFSNDNASCSYCNEFVSQVISLQGIRYTITEGSNEYWQQGTTLFICKTCLSRMIEALDNNMLQHFKSDFEEERNAVNNKG